MKFNPSKKRITHCSAELLADPFVKIKWQKTENRSFAEFKYLEKNQLYGTRRGSNIRQAVQQNKINARARLNAGCESC